MLSRARLVFTFLPLPILGCGDPVPSDPGLAGFARLQENLAASTSLYLPIGARAVTVSRAPLIPGGPESGVWDLRTTWDQAVLDEGRTRRISLGGSHLQHHREGMLAPEALGVDVAQMVAEARDEIRAGLPSTRVFVDSPVAHVTLSPGAGGSPDISWVRVDLPFTWDDAWLVYLGFEPHVEDPRWLTVLQAGTGETIPFLGYDSVFGLGTWMWNAPLDPLDSPWADGVPLYPAHVAASEYWLRFDGGRDAPPARAGGPPGGVPVRPGPFDSALKTHIRVGPGARVNCEGKRRSYDEARTVRWSLDVGDPRAQTAIAAVAGCSSVALKHEFSLSGNTQDAANELCMEAHYRILSDDGALPTELYTESIKACAHEEGDTPLGHSTGRGRELTWPIPAGTDLTKLIVELDLQIDASCAAGAPGMISSSAGSMSGPVLQWPSCGFEPAP